MSTNTREELRETIRNYYNTVFDYAMERIRKGDLAALIANAETKQRSLDDPYLDKLEALIKDAQNKLLDRVEAEVIGSFENTQFTDKLGIPQRNSLRAEQRKAISEIRRGL